MREAFLPESLTHTLPLQIAERVGAAIVDERFPPGERLKEVELAATFGVSRATVREALRILENRGLISILPQRGAQVSSLSRKELEDMFEIRAVLLGLASRRVAETCTPETERRLLAGFQALQAARRDHAAYVRASADLAMEIARLSGNLQLADHIASFAQRIGRYARMGLRTQIRREQSLADWRKLFRAMAARDGNMAEAMHRRLSTQNCAAALAELDRREHGEPAVRNSTGAQAHSKPMKRPKIRKRSA